MRTLLPLLLVLTSLGCERNITQPGAVLVAPVPPQAPPTNLKVRDTQTIHDTPRIWVIQTGHDGHDRIIMCDVELLKANRPLCVRWPGSPEDEVHVPVAPPNR